MHFDEALIARSVVVIIVVSGHCLFLLVCVCEGVTGCCICWSIRVFMCVPV